MRSVLDCGAGMVASLLCLTGHGGPFRDNQHRPRLLLCVYENIRPWAGGLPF